MSTILINVTLVIGGVGALFSIFGLVVSGSGDHPEAYLGYLPACAVVIGAATIAAAIRDRGASER